MSTFSIEIPPDADFYNTLMSSLSTDSSIAFTVSEVADLMESEGASPDILAYIFSFPTAAVFAAALKYISPIVTEFIKSRQINIKIDDMEVRVTNTHDLERAITAANDLSALAGRKKLTKSKK